MKPCLARFAIRSLAGLLSCLLTIPGLGNPILEWNDLFLDAIRADSTAPTLASRNLAILHTAVYDAVNAIESTHQPYRFLGHAPPGALPEAAAVGAAFAVSVLLYPHRRAEFDGAYAGYLNSTTPGPAVTEGLQFGRLIGALAVDRRSDDGASTQLPYIPSHAPGRWQRTPPFFRPPLDPHWGWLEPFCLDDLEAFVPSGPPPLDSAAYAADFNQVKTLGDKVNTHRTAEQAEIAQFWSDFSYTETPPGHWIDIAAGILQEHEKSLAQTARVLALVSLAQADAAIVVWRCKYRYDFWRPATAISRADQDGNPATELGHAWESLLPTPPFPEYVSGHSAFSMSSAIVLGYCFGTDALSFEVRSDALPGVLRRFNSLIDCAEEVGMSRIYGGIHFMSANTDGKACGTRIGNYVSSNFLLPNSELPRLVLEKDGQASVTLRVHGHPGRICVLEFSPDLSSWTPVSTNQAQIGGFRFDPGQTLTPRFFRVREH